MLTASFLTGNILFNSDIKVTNKTEITLVIEEITNPLNPVTVLDKKVNFDPKALPIFKYLPFELKEFKAEENKKYRLRAFADVSGNGDKESGDYLTKKEYSIVTGFETLDLQMERRP